MFDSLEGILELVGKYEATTEIALIATTEVSKGAEILQEHLIIDRRVLIRYFDRAYSINSHSNPLERMVEQLARLSTTYRKIFYAL